MTHLLRAPHQSVLRLYTHPARTSPRARQVAQLKGCRRLVAGIHAAIGPMAPRPTSICGRILVSRPSNIQSREVSPGLAGGLRTLGRGIGVRNTCNLAASLVAAMDRTVQFFHYPSFSTRSFVGTALQHKALASVPYSFQLWISRSTADTVKQRPSQQPMRSEVSICSPRNDRLVIQAKPGL